MERSFKDLLVDTSILIKISQGRGSLIPLEDLGWRPIVIPEVVSEAKAKGQVVYSLAKSLFLVGSEPLGVTDDRILEALKEHPFGGLISTDLELLRKASQRYPSLTTMRLTLKGTYKSYP